MAETILEDVFMNIPTSIITDILARLPPIAVLRCRCVCKAWLQLISEAEFVNLHLSKSPTSVIVHKLYPKSPHSASFTLVEAEDEIDHHGVRRIAGMDRELPRSSKHASIGMVGSVDGLVCCASEYASQYELIHVWNPIMGEFITVQVPGGKRKYPNLTTYGFGTSSGKYLMVRIFQEIEIIDYTIYRERIRDSTCHVYTIGDGVWKNIGHAPYMFGRGEDGLFFNGNLHWFIHDQDGPEKICCLDLEKEVFQTFPPPQELCQGHIASLNLYKGCLSVCDNASDLDIVIWVMKEYGVQNSWSKVMVISKHSIDLRRHYYEVVRIIKVFKDGEILLLWRDKMVFSYNPKLKIVQDMSVKESMTGPSNNNPLVIHPYIETTEYVSSIVSLKSLGEVNVRRC